MVLRLAFSPSPVIRREMWKDKEILYRANPNDALGE